MRRIRSLVAYAAVVALAASVLPAGQAHAAAADRKKVAQEKERELIGVLKSDAPPAKKAITCKQLAIYGSKDAVGVLAPLLADKDLASWARIALEVIPGPVADDALREAMGKLKGRLLVGTINSIGVRRDAKAVDELVKKLEDADADVASAAAEAL
ncbi:MAG TPA: PBS lyase, partial [Phycisphaerae bacterium]|nr:PBS lyase [Phycisphaerae bacterium]